MSNPLNHPSSRSTRVLLAVRDLHEEVRAGFGQTECAVRTLDGVSLVIRAGELVVLQGGVASGAVSLLESLAGTRRRAWGTRVAARGVQIRRGSISAEAFRAIAAAWSCPARTSAPPDPAHAPVVYVFRVRHRDAMAVPMSPAPVTPPVSQEAWHSWVDALRARGGSVLAHVPVTAPPHSHRRFDQHGSAVHEPATEGAGYAAASSVLRVLTLSAGRIVAVERPRREPREGAVTAPPQNRRTAYIHGSSIVADSDPGS